MTDQEFSTMLSMVQQHVRKLARVTFFWRTRGKPRFLRYAFDQETIWNLIRAEIPVYQNRIPVNDCDWTHGSFKSAFVNKLA